MNATTITPIDAGARERLHETEYKHGAGTEFGQRRNPRVENAGLHPEALEPSARSGDLAAADDVIDAVRQHHDAKRAPQHQQRKVERVDLSLHAAERYAVETTKLGSNSRVTFRS